MAKKATFKYPTICIKYKHKSSFQIEHKYVTFFFGHTQQQLPNKCKVKLDSIALLSLCVTNMQRDQKKSGARRAVDIWYPDFLVPLLFIFSSFLTWLGIKF